MLPLSIRLLDFRLAPLFDDPLGGTQSSFIRRASPQGTIPYPFIYHY